MERLHDKGVGFAGVHFVHRLGFMRAQVSLTRHELLVNRSCFLWFFRSIYAEMITWNLGKMREGAHLEPISASIPGRSHPGKGPDVMLFGCTN
jgi:hypothetical protein